MADKYNDSVTIFWHKIAQKNGRKSVENERKNAVFRKNSTLGIDKRKIVC